MYLVLAFCLLGFVSGCKNSHPKPPEMVYVDALGNLYLHNRVAIVSDRVAEVKNGEALQVLEQAGRFLKVKTKKGKVGWIEQSAVIDSSMYNKFVQLAAAHKKDQVVATGSLDYELYMHLMPGRKTQHFYLLPRNTKVQLLARATAPRTLPPGSVPTPFGSDKAGSKPVPGIPQAPRTVLEDWWLARDAKGQTGWMLASGIYVNVPPAIEQYASGQQFIGAYKLTTVKDPKANYPNHEVPEYVTLLAPLDAGRTYDFNEVRVFTWSVIHHRYETAFEVRPIYGFLPAHTGFTKGPDGKTVPTFSFKVSKSADVVTDPSTGITSPVSSRTVRYEMLETVVRRIGPDKKPIPLMHQGTSK